MSKKLVITADDFGISKEANTAIQKAFTDGVLTSTCIMANGDAFDHAIEILPDFSEISMGVHLNIIEGKSLVTPDKVTMLCDAEGNYKNGFASLLAKSSSPTFLNEVEYDFRSQIEKILDKTPVSHINSHVHTHAIPNLFKLTCHLAKEYSIKYVRTQTEIPYMVPSLRKHLQVRYPINLIKAILLGAFSTANQEALREYDLLTNDYFIGIAYTGYMDENALLSGIKAIKKDGITEVILHPTMDKTKQDNYQEFLSFTNPKLKTEIEKSDWKLTNHKLLLDKIDSDAIKNIR